jgi:uncharacterized protein YecE (DUF72 family)
VFDRSRIKAKAAELAASGVFIGTSSWKYQGWMDQLYSRDRYEYRGKFAEARFKRNCLSEYAEVFKTVCLDSAYYDFPKPEKLREMAASVPNDFQFSFKVTDAITLKKFTNQPRHGIRAGKPNENFLNANLFATAFLKPCEEIRSQIGVLMFEFSRFHKTDFEHGRDFVAALDSFFGKLPTGWPYAVEMRNQTWLQPDYFECLARHNVTHVFNSWSAMPPVIEQMALPGSLTNPNLCAARFLLKPGRSYEEAVKTFEPYNKIQDEYPDAREAAQALIAEGKSTSARKTYIYVNNRLEGNAPETIAAMI